MKKIFLLSLFLGIFSLANAQAFRGPGDQKLQLGLNAFGYGTGITGSYEYGILDWMSIGGGGEFFWSNDDDNFFIYGKANFHLGDAIGLPSNMDLYPGINIGGRNDGFGIGAHLGYRYFFSQNLGVFAEIGSHGAIGVTINL